MSGQPASRRGTGEAGLPRRSGHSLPSLGSPAAIPRVGETARKRATGAGNVPAPAFSSRLTVPWPASGATTTFGSALLPPSFLILLPSLYPRRCRSFSVLPNSLLSLQETDALPPTPLPPTIVWPVLIVRCPVPSVTPASPSLFHPLVSGSPPQPRAPLTSLVPVLFLLL